MMMEGLLSLSLAAASAAPIPVSRDTSQDSGFASSYGGQNSVGNGPNNVSSSLATKSHPHKHRRLSSTGQARRLSDAREAASRPSPIGLSTAAAALTSLAKLSLSATPPPQTATTLVSASGVIHSSSSAAVSQQNASNEVSVKSEEVDRLPTKTDIAGAGISITSAKGSRGKKRSTILKCESCSKAYRHPSCLIKHRWEHSPHWREASKLLLSKHQQVQLLEAAAILSHLSPSSRGGTSLPEDRSLWPSFLSGGLLPPPSPVNTIPRSSSAAEPSAPFPSSSSVPASSVFSSSERSGPRMRDYSVLATGGITQLRPGVLAVPTGSQSPAMRASPSDENPLQRSAAVPVPTPEREPLSYSFASQQSDTWSSPISIGFAQSSFRSSSAFEHSYSEGTGEWSIPRSSIRSCSRSRSGSVSESDYVDVDGDGDDYGIAGRHYGFSARSQKVDEGIRAVKVGHDKIEEEWDGMEMEMEM
ncbi:uncharacterized protein LAESUDRAFT_814503 [Laetiporus sulphureus 93-53]|uniref:C2H2-type domain-containing protein n=1 Tax=Laetiporus sulphureus 93-53 TaxID=1314785 RepID=A0A165CWY3_9APHY|nr:uncharacterized protein LAESUDRAFT_814503 [Laetiporus sulphureus 93-53]KZT03622.1 hypothetical protein LAESUDRAFT_814503 [Laetiporus sulphureus 93-53]